MERPLLLQAPAKINLYLGVHAERDARGYHRVTSLMCALDLADELRVTPAPELAVTFDPPIDAPAEKTAVWKAATRLGEEFGNKPQVHIVVTRRVPVQAGLGGASADAAAALVALCELWGIRATDERVAAVARGVGADVPFFLYGGPLLLEGAGDVPSERFDLGRAELPVALVRADGPGVPTPEAYATWDADPVPEGPVEPLARALRARAWCAVPALISNNLAPVAERLSPACGEVRRWLAAQPGANAALVSGSGSCCYALCASASDAARIAVDARARGWWGCATKLTELGACLV